MKKLLFVLLLIAASVGFSFAQDRQAILNVLHTQELAWNRADIEGFMQGYWKSDSLLFVGSKGPTYGWNATLANYKRSYPGKAGMGQLTFNIIKVEVFGTDNAYVYGGWKLQREKDSPGGYFTLWFRKINGEWKIVVDHTS